MNERIKQLARNAGISILYKYDGYDGHAAVLDYNDIELFAQLIVYECVDLALGSSHREDDMGAIIAKKIEQHFGVE
jgi:hypothetical protein